MNYSLLYSALALIHAGALMSNVNAALLIDYNFEDGLTAGWAAPAGVLSVVNDPLNSENKVLRVDYNNDVRTATMTTEFGPVTGGGIFRLDLDIYIENPENIATDLLDRRISLSGPSAAAVTYTRFKQSSDSLVFNAYTGSGWSPQVIAFNDTWYHLTQIVDLDNQTWVWSLSDADGNTVIYNETTNLKFVGGEIFTIQELRFADIAGKGGVFYIDNVRFGQIPEPQTMSLLGMAASMGLLLLLRR